MREISETTRKALAGAGLNVGVLQREISGLTREHARLWIRDVTRGNGILRTQRTEILNAIWNNGKDI